MSSFKSIVFKYIWNPLFKIRLYQKLCRLCMRVLLLNIPSMFSLSPSFANPGHSTRSDTSACSIKQEKSVLILLCYIWTSSIRWKFYQSYYNTLLGKIMCESFTSAVHEFGRCLNFTRCVYCTRNHSVHIVSIVAFLFIIDTFTGYLSYGKT